MHPAALSGGSLEPAVRGCCEPAVRVGDDQAHTGEAPVAQRAQELLPEPFALAVADVTAQHLPVAVSSDPSGHRRRLGDAVAHVQIGGVEIDVGELDVVQAPGAERLHALVEARADTRHLRLRDAGLRAQSSHQIID